MDSDKEQNSFNLNQKDSNIDQVLNSFAQQNILDIPSNQMNADLGNNIFSSFQPNASELNNQLDKSIEKEKEESNKNDEASNNKKNESENKISPKVPKRRSKCEIEGRTFECKLCKKRYLSYHQ